MGTNRSRAVPVLIVFNENHTTTDTPYHNISKRYHLHLGFAFAEVGRPLLLPYTMGCLPESLSRPEHLCGSVHNYHNFLERN